jgi:GNAT superfamily N-acetyltransferase
MEILRVLSKSELRAFVDLPRRLYAHDPLWVPSLPQDERSKFDPERNPYLQHCDHGLFVLRRGNEVVGRIAAFIDRLAVDFWKEPIGLFGHYECIDDSEASRMLLQAASDWLRARGMTTMRGPWSFVSQEWGSIVEGFAPPPTIMAPYNPPYYNDHVEAFGLRKVKDLLAYAISGEDGYRIPDRILHSTDIVAKRYGVRVRPIDMRRYDEEVRTLMDLSNGTITGNWGYSPVTEEEVQAMAHDLKRVIQPKGVLFAEDPDGRPIAFAIAIPDVNFILKKIDGRLLPFGWLRLLWGVPRLRRYRMWALGVSPEYQGKGVDSLIYRALYESLYTPDIWMEINYVLEDNAPMNNAIRKLGARPLRRYRIYEMPLQPATKPSD